MAQFITTIYRRIPKTLRRPLNPLPTKYEGAFVRVRIALEVLDQINSKIKNSVAAHAFSNYWVDMVDLFEPDWNLFHLWFVRVRDGKYDLDTKPKQAHKSEKEIKEVIKILDSTRGAFKSKEVQEARERLEKLIK